MPKSAGQPVMWEKARSTDEKELKESMDRCIGHWDVTETMLAFYKSAK